LKKNRVDTECLVGAKRTHQRKEGKKEILGTRKSIPGNTKLQIEGRKRTNLFKKDLQAEQMQGTNKKVKKEGYTWFHRKGGRRNGKKGGGAGK